MGDNRMRDKMPQLLPTVYAHSYRPTDRSGIVFFISSSTLNLVARTMNKASSRSIAKICHNVVVYVSCQFVIPEDGPPKPSHSGP